LQSRHRLTGGRETVAEALAAELRERHRLGVTPAVWNGKPPPDHLRVRVRVTDEGGRELAATREWAEVRAVAAPRAEKEESEAEARAAQAEGRRLENELRY